MDDGNLPCGNLLQVAIENGHVYLIFPLKIVVIRSYVSLPEGNGDFMVNGPFMSNPGISSLNGDFSWWFFMGHTGVLLGRATPDDNNRNILLHPKTSCQVVFIYFICSTKKMWSEKWCSPF